MRPKQVTQYEFSNLPITIGMGNVLTTVTDKKIPVDVGNDGTIDYYVADITSATDYYPFGSPMDGRTFSSDKYRFGFNGKERDNEIQGDGNSYDFGARIYDSRLGRWLSLDPLRKEYSSITPYSFVANSPLIFLDGNGKALVDANGNIIVTRSGVRTPIQHSVVNRTDNKDGSITLTSIQFQYEEVTMYCNDGQPFKALLTINATTTYTTYSADGKTILSSETEIGIKDRSVIDPVSDCHGLTIGNNLIWINNEEMQTVLDHDGYTSTDEKNADIVVFRAAVAGDGDAVKAGDIIHSSKKESDGTYTSDAGSLSKKSNLSLQGAAGEAFNIDDLYSSQGGRTMTDITKTGTVNFYKHNGNRVTTLVSPNILPAGSVDGIKEYSKEDVNKTLKK